ncbi:MAG: ABC transporter ATP-binding protein [Clostridia bacterium]|nr:ABC transporter ATP-binding protein [Clostridia bacterium]
MNAIELRGLTKKYDTFTLDNINLTLPSGCIMGLVGENGAGKSTMIKLIINMISRDGGDITVLGKDTAKDIDLIKNEIGIVLDEVGIPACLNACQVERIMRHTFKKWDSERYRWILDLLSIDTKKPFGKYSRGMKMKLGLAVAMSHGAKLLILDEATSGIDPVDRDRILELLCDFTRVEHHSVLISSHIVSDLEKLCDYITFLHKGKLMLSEEKDALLSNYGIVRLTSEEFAGVPREAVVYKKDNPYYTEALILREKLSFEANVLPVSIEELFVFMVKEEEKL